MRYGIRMTRVTWASIDGGPDLHGTRDQMATVAERWRREASERASQDEVVSYDVVPYVGQDPADVDAVTDFLRRHD